jgi:hypothetical protein
MNEIPPYAPLKPVEPPIDPVARSVARDGAFSKPGTTKSGKSGKGWAPGKGVRFRSVNEPAKGRPRKRPRDPRSVEFF